ncbi:unnamed protein product [Ixodes hexagonus]
MADMSSESDWSTLLDNPIILHDRMMSDAVQSPRIQSEHSYSMTSSGDEGPDSPLSITPHIKIEDMESECFPAVPVSTATGQSDLAGGVVVKQEPLSPPPPPPAASPPPPISCTSQSRRHASSSRLLSSALASAPLAGPGALAPCLTSGSGQPLQQQQQQLQLQQQQQSLLKQPTIVLAAARPERHLVFPKVNIKLEPPSGFVLPPTPPSSHSSDSDGSLSPVHSTDNRTPTSFTAAASTSEPVSSGASSQHVTSSSMSRRSQSHSRVAAASSSSSSSRASGSGGLISSQAKGATGVLVLTDEEKRTLLAEGYPIPQRLPLTKAEERSLKKIRRKIKNKVRHPLGRKERHHHPDASVAVVAASQRVTLKVCRAAELATVGRPSLLSQLQRLQLLLAGDCSAKPGRSSATATKMDLETEDEPVDII